MICRPNNAENATEGALPAWINDQLVAETKAAWEPIYGRKLTESEAIEILLNVGRLLDALR